MSEREETCSWCDGDGYTERWNDDQSDVVIELCAYCSPAVSVGGCGEGEERE